MSDNARTEVRLILGRGDRSITEQGEGVEQVDPSAAQYAGVGRQIIFHDCKNTGGDIEWNGGSSVDVWVIELPPKQETWPDQPWGIGSINPRHDAVNLHVSSVLFQQFWDMADEGAVLHVTAHRDPRGFFFISQTRLEFPPRVHPVVIERQRHIFNRWARGAIRSLWWLVGAIIVIELIHWLWR